MSDMSAARVLIEGLRKVAADPLVPDEDRRQARALLGMDKDEALQEAVGLLRLFRDAGVQMPEGWPHDRDESITRLEKALEGVPLEKFHDEAVMEEIEKRNLGVERNPFNGAIAKWKVLDHDDVRRGFGRTLAEALKDYDTDTPDVKP